MGCVTSFLILAHVLSPLSGVLCAKEKLMDYQANTGRLSEVLIGIVTTFISLIFFGLVFILFDNGKTSFAAAVGVLALSFLGLWFALLSYRLLFHKPKKYGGLISPLALKFWCVVFGLSSTVFLLFGILELNIKAVFSSIIMLPACWYGWQLANKRQRRNGT